MSKPWNPKLIPLQPSPRSMRRGPGDFLDQRRGRRRYRRRGLARSELRLMILGGMFVGLACSIVPNWIPQEVAEPEVPIAAPHASADPYAESRRSLENLKAQEGAPPRAVADPRGAGSSRSQGVSRVARVAAVHVVDGDTFHYGGQRIRIADIDTPETHPPRCAREAELGARATRRLREWIAAGPFDLIPIDRDEDRYGRKLRIVSRGGTNVGDLLIAEGLARPYAGGRRSWCG